MTQKDLIVKHHCHGILSVNRRPVTNTLIWIFKSSDTYKEYEGRESDFIYVLDDLSLEGYELVCHTEDNDYIFRTKKEIENTFEFVDEASLNYYLHGHDQRKRDSSK
jgi:hypothetical protein